MRMHGSWHIYRPGERWQRPRHEMRIVIETAPYVAVAFTVPVAEFVDAATVDREGPVAELGPDLLSDELRRRRGRGAAAGARRAGDRRCAARSARHRRHRQRVQVRDAVRRAREPVHAGAAPSAPTTLARIVAIAERQMRANVGDAASPRSAAGARPTGSIRRRASGCTDAAACRAAAAARRFSAPSRARTRARPTGANGANRLRLQASGFAGFRKSLR